MLDVALVVPAYDEGSTIGGVVRTAITSGLFRQVIVVNDGSRDCTSDIASKAGALVIDLYPNQGKGAAMRRALECVETEYVMFCDADLLKVEGEHFQTLIDKMLTGYDLVVGVLSDPGQKLVPCWSGQKIISTSNVRSFFEANPSIESFVVDGAMIRWAQRNDLNVGFVAWRNIKHVRKVAKRGFIEGWKGYFQMWWDIFRGK